MAVLAQELRGAIGRSVIDDNDLGVEAAIQHPLDHTPDRRGLVVHRNHHRNFSPIRHQLPLASRCCPSDAAPRAANSAFLPSRTILAASIAATLRRSIRRRRAEKPAEYPHPPRTRPPFLPPAPPRGPRLTDFRTRC